MSVSVCVSVCLSERVTLLMSVCLFARVCV
jgi:hypothetical protein